MTRVSSTPVSSPGQPGNGAPPALHTGDRLTVEEFERRYEAMPEVKKAELIEGVVFMGSPVATESHGTPHFALGAWLGIYWFNTPGTQGAANSTLKLKVGANRLQPDIFLRILPECGGQSRTDEKGYLVGSPELATEISSSSVGIDLGDKKEVYRKNDVREYIVWRVEERAIDWFLLRQGQYDALTADAQGILKSLTFPGLWLDVDAMIRGDFIQVQKVLHTGLAAPEHAVFVAELARRKN